MKFSIRDLCWLMLVIAILAVRGWSYRSGYAEAVRDLQAAIQQAGDDGKKIIITKRDVAIPENPLAPAVMEKGWYVLYASDGEQDRGITGYFWKEFQ